MNVGERESRCAPHFTLFLIELHAPNFSENRACLFVISAICSRIPWALMVGAQETQPSTRVAPCEAVRCCITHRAV
jgi:hypothetical protein